MKKFLILGMLIALVGCGGGRSYDRGPVVTRIASGPISKACMASDRKARSRQLCGCIQAVADQRLTGAEQRKAASFYADPQKAQDIRQSDNSSHERFWRRYKAYAESARQTCG